MKKFLIRCARSGMFAICGFSLLVGTNPALAVAANPQMSRLAEAYPAERFLSLTNALRLEYGTTELHLNNKLQVAAQAKAADMVQRGYWEHFRPGDNKAPWAFIEESGYSYKVAGENLARGFSTPEGITKAWMASPTHRANLLSGEYTEMGLACIRVHTASGESYLITVQMFGSPQP